MASETISSDDRQLQANKREVIGRRLLEELIEEAGLRASEIDDLDVILRGRSRDYANRSQNQGVWRGMNFRAVIKTLREQILCPELPCELEARSIMGANFLGLPEVCRALGRGLTENELLQFRKTLPFSVETLKACKDTHVLVAPAAIDLKAMVSHFKNQFAPGEAEKITAKVYSFDDHEWHLVRKQPIKISTQKQLENRLKLLESGCEQRPSFVTLLWMMLVYQNSGSGERLFRSGFARPREMHGTEFAIGNPTPEGIQIKQFWTDQSYADVGLATEHKHDNPNYRER